MKKLLLLILCLKIFAITGTLTDSRDGKIYRTETIGEQEWMIENLNYQTSESFCYEGKKDNCKKYGRLYNQKAAMQACPAEWRLPNKYDWKYLIDMKKSGNAQFSVNPVSGYADPDGSFGGLDSVSWFWSNSIKIGIFAPVIFTDTLIFFEDFNVNNGMSVRCIQGDTPAEYSAEEFFVDTRDGNGYKLVKIENQTWFAENLAYQTSESSCFADPDLCKKYGRFYSESERSVVCPAGTRLPNKSDWEELFKNVSEYEQMMDESWAEGYNKVGLNILPSGRIKDGNLNYLNQAAHFWTSENVYVAFDEQPYNAEIRYTSGEDRKMTIRCILNGIVLYDLMKNQKFSKDIDKVLKDVAGLQTTGKTVLGGRHGKADGGFNEGYAEGGSGGIATKAKGSIKTPSERDIDVEVGGSRAAADITKVVRQRIPGLRHIYNKCLKKKPGFQGKVTLKFTIAPGGEIISISIASSTTGYGEFDGEIKTAVSRWKFSRVKFGNTTVTIPFEFSE